VYFKKSPLVKKAIKSAVGEKLVEFNEKLPYFFQEATINYLAGAPYKALEQIPLTDWSNSEL
jgi:hypothetical protein